MEGASDGDAFLIRFIAAHAMSNNDTIWLVLLFIVFVIGVIAGAIAW